VSWAGRQGGHRTAVRVTRSILCLLFFNGTIVVHEYEGAFVLRVNVALGAFVARAEIT